MNSFNRLIKVIARLRSPTGCPWDRQQTHTSLLKYLFEESREFKRAVRKRDYENMQEELGDLLFQVVLHSQLASEKKRFSIDDVIDDQIRKLTLRHPHVFGFKAAHRKLLKNKKLKSVDDILSNWKILKEISRKK
jgi:tetrapyrrole methylase family protein / MazG family protein